MDSRYNGHDGRRSESYTENTDLGQAVIACTEPMLWFSKKRMELEMMFMELFNSIQKC
ncbi:hypothetical protein DPMN_048685 [Dreissena polymorpha]|uniref:Uncharacterized protein n=1 Tax=Dreissena polymorpha TaxID=45954 RepID=A0A9D4I0E6_DREPO|nr:hypothetical protein DPMN_048685 [Dreissena polymorpha]